MEQRAQRFFWFWRRRCCRKRGRHRREPAESVRQAWRSRVSAHRGCHGGKECGMKMDDDDGWRGACFLFGTSSEATISHGIGVFCYVLFVFTCTFEPRVVPHSFFFVTDGETKDLLPPNARSKKMWASRSRIPSPHIRQRRQQEVVLINHRPYTWYRQLYCSIRERRPRDKKQ